MNRVLGFTTLIIFICSTTNCTGSPPCGATCEPTDEEDRTVNTEKLIGTPFEGKTAGDDFDWDFFICGQYRTDSIDSFPIKIFTAYFDNVAEEIISQGVAVTNEAVGFEAYELTDEWSDDVRVIYQVNNIADENDTEVIKAAGLALVNNYSFNNKLFAETVTTDWAIEVEDFGTGKWLFAHELGHATGLGHDLIDYENDTTEELEEDSLMDSTGAGGIEPALNDYNFMMQKQGEIMLNHLGDTGGTLDTGNCGDE